MKLIFCGTPAFAVPTLEKLVEAEFEIALVVTQPDRSRGRGLEIDASPVKQKAIQLGLQVVQPQTIKNNTDFRAQIEGLNPEAIVVVGYGRIIPQWMIDLPRFGNINLHASLLPKYRGAAPIQWAIANGERLTGVTTMRIDAGLDTGSILQQKEIAIGPDDTAITLGPKLAEIGSELMADTLRGLLADKIKPQPQDHTRATLAPILKKEDGRIDFHRPAEVICNRMRGFRPWPGAFTTFRQKILNISKAKSIGRETAIAELFLEDDQLLAGCGNGTSLSIIELQPEGKRRMSARDFIQGYRPRNAELLGS